MKRVHLKGTELHSVLGGGGASHDTRAEGSRLNIAQGGSERLFDQNTSVPVQLSLNTKRIMQRKGGGGDVMRWRAVAICTGVRPKMNTLSR